MQEILRNILSIDAIEWSKFEKRAHSSVLKQTEIIGRIQWLQ